MAMNNSRGTLFLTTFLTLTVHKVKSSSYLDVTRQVGGRRYHKNALYIDSAPPA